MCEGLGDQKATECWHGRRNKVGYEALVEENKPSVWSVGLRVVSTANLKINSKERTR
jgi:hypothetical protein